MSEGVVGWVLGWEKYPSGGIGNNFNVLGIFGRHGTQMGPGGKFFGLNVSIPQNKRILRDGTQIQSRLYPPIAPIHRALRRSILISIVPIDLNNLKIVTIRGSKPLSECLFRKDLTRSPAYHAVGRGCRALLLLHLTMVCAALRATFSR